MDREEGPECLLFAMSREAPFRMEEVKDVAYMLLCALRKLGKTEKKAVHCGIDKKVDHGKHVVGSTAAKRP